MPPSELEAAISRIENPPPVLTKFDFVHRFSQGEFGNRGPMWDTVQDFLKLDRPPKGLLHLRNRVAGGPTWYNLTYQQLITRCQELRDVSSYYVALMAPTEQTVCQGEVFQSDDRGPALYYSTIAKPMRDALKENAKHVYGIRAIETLKFYVDPPSYDWLQVLLERYPSHVVEFSTYSVEFGTVPGMRTVVWEVRAY